MQSPLPHWALELCWSSPDDASLPSAIDGVNIVLNRARLAVFLSQFAEDRDVRDFLTLDVIGSFAGLQLSSTGLVEPSPSLATRPFRLWEYIWLYKSLGLSKGGLKVLDLGGPASHLSVLAALAGCQVTSIDINPEFVDSARKSAESLELSSLEPLHGDMRDLSRFGAETFDAVVCSSVLEHLTAEDQGLAVREMSRVLKPNGLIGLTFDYGPGAPGMNEHLPPPHEPPPDSSAVAGRYVQPGLAVAGNPFVEDPRAGSLFLHETIGYTVASLFLSKNSAHEIRVPQPEPAGPDSPLGRLVIRDMARRIYAGVSAQEWHRVKLLEKISIERLAAIQEKEAALTQLHAALNVMRPQLELAVETIHAQAQRAAVLEQICTERLTAMHEKDAVITELDAALKNRYAPVKKLLGISTGGK